MAFALALAHAGYPRFGGRWRDMYGLRVAQDVADQAAGAVDALVLGRHAPADLGADALRRVAAREPLGGEGGQLREHAAWDTQASVEEVEVGDRRAGLFRRRLGRSHPMVGGVPLRGFFWMTTGGPTPRPSGGRRSDRRSRDRDSPAPQGVASAADSGTLDTSWTVDHRPRTPCWRHSWT